MSNPEHTLSSRHLHVSVARMFYIDGMAKSDIATVLGISRFRVARLLDDAIATGLVQITIAEDPAVDRSLGRALEDRFGIRHGLVLRFDESESDPLRMAAMAAAGLLRELADRQDSIGVAWGSSVAAVVDALAPGELLCRQVVQLAGGSLEVRFSSGPDEVGRRLARLAGCPYRALHAPAVLASKELRDVLVQEPAISATLAEQSDLDIALVGIGQSSRAAIDCAGELVLHSYDDRGALLVNDGAERSIGISIDALRRTPTVLAIACGVEKTRAIAGALRTGIVNMLVTDAATAEAVLAFEASDPETLK